MSECRDLPPLAPLELAALEIYLDAQPATRRVALTTAQQLVATCRALQRQVRDARAAEAADLTPDQETR